MAIDGVTGGGIPGGQGDFDIWFLLPRTKNSVQEIGTTSPFLNTRPITRTQPVEPTRIPTSLPWKLMTMDISDTDNDGVIDMVAIARLGTECILCHSQPLSSGCPRSRSWSSRNFRIATIVWNGSH